MLLEYLQDYTDRVKPLQDQNELFGKIQNEFEKKWENGTFPGWPVSSSGIGERTCRSLGIGCDCEVSSSATSVWFSSHAYFGMRFVRASLPLAEPSIFANCVTTIVWFLLTQNWKDYVLESPSCIFTPGDKLEFSWTLRERINRLVFGSALNRNLIHSHACV